MTEYLQRRAAESAEESQNTEFFFSPLTKPGLASNCSSSFTELLQHSPKTFVAGFVFCDALAGEA